jgi:hypothetical protein
VSAQAPPASHKVKHRVKSVSAPDFVHAERARKALAALLEPKRTPGKAATPFKCDATTRLCLTHILVLLRIYTSPVITERLSWIAASLRTSSMFEKSTASAEQLRIWAQQWITDRQVPANLYGTWTSSMLDNGDLAQTIHEHLQELGVYRKAEDVVWFLDRPAVQKKFNLQKGISLATARRWMKNMNYWWKKNSKGETCFSAHLAKAK